MAESAKGKSQVDIDFLKETLCTQQKLLQKLYNELEAEREASSSAASEALSMILRLQGEKAAMKMEAEQYKRMVEEKMCHAEESLAIFEDIMYQKEMEVAALDYQVQAYRHKLISMGCVDPGNGNGDIKFPENLLQRSESKTGEGPPYPSLARRNSAPMLLPPKYPSTKKGIMEKDRSLSPDRDKDVEDSTGQYYSDSNSESGKKTETSAMGDINSYWEEIRKLDARVKELAGVSFANLQCSSRSSSLISQRSGNLYDLTKGAISNETDEVKNPEKMVDTEITSECASSPGVLDVFEVPQTNQHPDDPQLHNKNRDQLHTGNQEKMILQGEDKLQKPDSVVPEEIVESSTKDESDWLKRMLKSSHCESNSSKQSEAVAVACNMAIVHSMASTSESSNRLQQLRKISEIVEVERQAARQQSADRREELKLLNEIREKLNTIQYDVRSLRPKKPSPGEELAYVTLMEEMLHFWL